MTTPTLIYKTIYKTLNKSFIVLDKKFKIKIEYTNDETSPYNIEVIGIDIKFERIKRTRNLEEIPEILIEIKKEAEDEVKAMLKIENNIDKLKKYINDI